MEMVLIHDWMKFRSLETLPQKVGVSRDKLGLLVAKELVDNALITVDNVKLDIWNRMDSI